MWDQGVQDVSGFTFIIYQSDKNKVFAEKPILKVMTIVHMVSLIAKKKKKKITAL